MKSSDQIERLVKSSRVKTSENVDDRILADTKAAFIKSRKNRPTASQPGLSIWRLIMKKPITKLATAAVIIVAIMIGINSFFGTGTSVAFADVIQPILDARTVIMDILIGPEGRQAVIHDEVMGSRIRRTVSNVQGTDIIIDLEQMKMLVLAHAGKTAAYIELEGLGKMPNYLELLQDVVTRMQDKEEFQVQDQGLQEIDGHDYIVFVAESENDTITIWADPETALPVRIKQKTPNMQIICNNLQFDVVLDESRFSMEIPDGYVVQQAGGIDFKKSSESDFIETLRIWAEIIEDGHFPDSINLEDIVKIGPKIDQAFKQANLTKQQETEIAMRWGQGLVFIRFFKGQGQWHYAGIGVELGDGNTPIFWYQPKGSETWRVIYGDLTVEDAAEEDLPEPSLTEQQTKLLISAEQWEKQLFVGTEKDRWHITVSGGIVAYSEIALTKMPDETDVMYVKLPYPSGVMESAMVDDKPVAFNQVRRGQYELEIGFDKLRQGQPRILCTWTMPMGKLLKADYGYRINLQGLIPVEGFMLTVVLDPDCGFKFTKATSVTETVPFRADKLSSTVMDIGSCGIHIQKRN